jgi:hypothetical protein
MGMKNQDLLVFSSLRPINGIEFVKNPRQTSESCNRSNVPSTTFKHRFSAHQFLLMGLLLSVDCCWNL